MENSNEIDDFHTQLKEYSNSKQREFVAAKKAPPVRRERSIPNERTPLVSGAPTVESVEESSYLCPLYRRNNCIDECQCLSSSVQLGNLPITRSGVPLRIHYLWPFFIVLSAFPAFYVSIVVGVFSMVISGPILFISILLHEMGHAVAALQLGGKVSQILIWPLGGLAYISFFGDANPRADAFVAIAGPLSHVPQFLAWYLAMYMSNDGVVRLTWPTSIDWGYDFWLALCSAAMVLQIFLFVFNLIPAFPLDGGRLLGAVLSWFNFHRTTVFKVTAFVGGIFGLFFLIEGLRAASSREYRFYSSGDMMAIGVFILVNCFELWVLGSREATDMHPGYEWVDGRQIFRLQYETSTRPVGSGTAPHRGVSNIHGPGDAPREAQPRGPATMLRSGEKKGDIRNDSNYNRVASAMPGVGHRLGTSADMV